MIPFDILAELFTIATEPWGNSEWYHAGPPVRPSVARIQQQLGLKIPDDYLHLAKACPSYGGWLCGIGRDYKRHVHILNINAGFHTDTPDFAALPDYLVLLNHGHDHDCDCWDKRTVSASGEHPIVYVDADSPVRTPIGRQFNTFRDYLEHFVLTSAARNKNLERGRRANELVAKLHQQT